MQVGRLDHQADAVAFDVRHHQEVFDQARQAITLAVQHVEQRVALGLRELVAMAQRLDGTLHRGERRAELVRCDRDEVRLHRIELLQARDRCALLLGQSC